MTAKQAEAFETLIDNTLSRMAYTLGKVYKSHNEGISVHANIDKQNPPPDGTWIYSHKSPIGIMQNGKLHGRHGTYDLSPNWTYIVSREANPDPCTCQECITYQTCFIQ